MTHRSILALGVRSLPPVGATGIVGLIELCVEEAVCDLSGKTQRFIRFGKNVSIIQNILNTKPEDFVSKADTVPMSEEDFEREIQEFIENSNTETVDKSKKDAESIPEVGSTTFIVHGNIGTIGCVGGQMW